MLKRNVQNLNKEYLLICIVKMGVHVSALSALAQFELLLFRVDEKLLVWFVELLGGNSEVKKLP